MESNYLMFGEAACSGSGGNAGSLPLKNSWCRSDGEIGTPLNSIEMGHEALEFEGFEAKATRLHASSTQKPYDGIQQSLPRNGLIMYEMTIFYCSRYQILSRGNPFYFNLQRLSW